MNESQRDSLFNLIFFVLVIVSLMGLVKLGTVWF